MAAKSTAKPIVVSYLRFSNPSQAKGDSIRRQLDASEKWANERGLKLETPIKDSGVSAFRRKNATTGALAGFLALVEEGKVPPGSTLIVESLDRLSRAQINEALQQFLTVINKGVKIVTLMDGFEYDKDTTSMQNLMYSLMVMSRAHDESFTKSNRGKEAWRKKRNRIGNDDKPYTRKIGFWLKFDAKNGQKIIIDNEKVKLLRQIFKWASRDGMGPYAISRKLKEAGNPMAVQSLRYLLRSRQPLGEFQPCTVVYKDGRRFQEPVGKPILGYLPKAIDEATWNAAQRAFKERRYTGGRKNGVKINLFRNIISDDELNSWHMLFRYKRHRYFLANAPNGGYGSIPTSAVETAFLMAAQSFLDFSTHEDEGDSSKRIAETEAELIKIEAKIEMVQEEAVKSDDMRSIVGLLRKLEAEKFRLTAELRQLKIHQPVQTDHYGELSRLLPDALNDRLDNGDRARLAGLIRHFVQHIMMTCWRTGGKRTPSYHAKISVLKQDGATVTFGVSALPATATDSEGIRFYSDVSDMPARA